MDNAEALRLVQRIYTRLNARRPEIEKFESYYNGEQPLSFATSEWRKANSERYAGFSDNWAAPVVDAETERIVYTGMNLGPDSAKASAELHRHWLRNDGEAQSAQGFQTTLTAKRSFAIVWGDKNTDEPLLTWEHPSNVEIEYDFENPRIRKAALKTWVDDETEYATLYTPDSLWKFERPRASKVNERDSQAKQGRTGVEADGGWIPRAVSGEVWPLNNPMGVVPVVEVPNRPSLKGDPVSEIAGVIPMQDFINLMWAYLMLSADYASMPARVVLGGSPPMIPVLDADGKQVGTRAVDMKELAEKRLLYVSGDNPSIGSWEAARLDVFTDVIAEAVGHIASQTRTPPTYLVTRTGMSNVDGEGLKASEIGLNKKVGSFETLANPAMRDINYLIALASGDDALAEMIRFGIPTWMNPEIRSEAQLADMLVKKMALGYPLEYLMELDGISALDIPRIMALRKKEQELDPIVQAGRAFAEVTDDPESSGSTL